MGFGLRQHTHFITDKNDHNKPSNNIHPLTITILWPKTLKNEEKFPTWNSKCHKQYFLHMTGTYSAVCQVRGAKLPLKIEGLPIYYSIIQWRLVLVQLPRMTQGNPKWPPHLANEFTSMTFFCFYVIACLFVLSRSQLVLLEFNTMFSVVQLH